MRKPLLIIAALIVGFASCTKPASNNGPFTCTCDYAFQRGFYWVNDTTVNTTYANYTSFTDAQLYCTNAESTYKADTTKHAVKCFVH